MSQYVSQTGAEVARFEYDPFGNLTVDAYSNVTSFHYCSSTKPQEGVTGLYYYGYRWFDPVTGRWPSRDPIEERGGVNLYGFVGNDGIDRWDELGREWKDSKWTGKGAPWDTDDYINEKTSTGVTEGYCGAARKYPDNPWLKCACVVSNTVSGMMLALQSAALVVGLQGDIATRDDLMDRWEWFRCTRVCMAKKWRVGFKAIEGGALTVAENARLTEPWKKCCNVKNKGISGKRCCKLQVRAEQSGLQDCMKQCGKWKWGSPAGPFKMIPPWPANADSNDLEERIKYGNKRCCDGLP